MPFLRRDSPRFRPAEPGEMGNEGAIVGRDRTLRRMSPAADARTAGATRSPQLSAGEELLLHCLRSDTARSAPAPLPETTSIDWIA